MIVIGPGDYLLRRIDFQKDALLFLLLFADLAFIILHILYRYTDSISSGLYSLSRDRGFAEFFQYIKQFWIAVLLLAIAFRQRKLLYPVLAFVFLSFLVDDAFQYHESVGRLLADLFNLPAPLGLEPKDLGELIVFAITGILLAAAVAIFYFLADEETRAATRPVIALIAVFAVFGVLVDLIHSMITVTSIARIVTIIEESGEMLVMSVTTWMAYRLNAAQPPPTADADTA